MRHLCISFVVWGRTFTDILVTDALPSMLAPGNLPSFAYRRMTEVLIITTGEDEAHIKASAAYERLLRYVPVTFLNFAPAPVQQVVGDMKYVLMTAMHEFMIKYARLKRAAVMMLTPDILMADGAMQRIAQSIDQGKRVMMAHAPMLDRDGFMPEIARWLEAEGRGDDHRHGIIAVPARAMMGMAMRHLHPMTFSYFRESDQFNLFPSFMYWPLGERGLLCRCPHLGPVYFEPENWDAAMFDDSFRTIDQKFIMDACPDLASYDFCSDSDEFLYVEIGPSSKQYPIPDRHFASPADFAVFARRELNAFNLRFFREKVWLHDGIDRADYAGIERESDRFVDQVMDNLALIERAERGILRS